MFPIFAAVALAAIEPGANCDTSAPVDCGSWSLAGTNSSTVIASLQTVSRYLICARPARPDQGYSKRVTIIVDNMPSEGRPGDKPILGPGACVVVSGRHIQIAAIDAFGGVLNGVYRKLDGPAPRQPVRWTTLFAVDPKNEETVLLLSVDKPQIVRVCVGEPDTTNVVMPPDMDPQSGRSALIYVDGIAVHSSQVRTPVRIIGGSCIDVEGSRAAIAPSTPGKPETVQSAGLLVY